MSSYSDSESDNEAPEAITQSTAKQVTQQLTKSENAREISLAKLKKEKNRANDARLKGKAKVKIVEEIIEPVEEESEIEELSFEEHDDVVQSDEEPEEEELNQSATASSSKYLDPSMFATAAAAYKTEKVEPIPAGMGKHKLKRKIRAEKNARAIIAAERAAQVGEGGARQVGGQTVQHLPSITKKTPNLSTTTRPSHTSATKFISDRLYSKKRVMTVLDAGKPRDDGSERKRKKGGMSDESKILLGIKVDEVKATVGSSKSDKKRSLMLQAEGARKKVVTGSRISSSKGVARPAANFSSF